MSSSNGVQGRPFGPAQRPTNSPTTGWPAQSQPTTRTTHDLAIKWKPAFADEVFAKYGTTNPDQPITDAELLKKVEWELRQRLALPVGSQLVGWVERSDTYQFQSKAAMGFASLYPSYGPSP